MHNSNDQGNTSNRNIATSNICEMGRGYRLNQKQKSYSWPHFTEYWAKAPTGKNRMESCLKGSYFKNNNNIYDQITPTND